MSHVTNRKRNLVKCTKTIEKMDDKNSAYIERPVVDISVKILSEMNFLMGLVLGLWGHFSPYFHHKQFKKGKFKRKKKNSAKREFSFSVSGSLQRKRRREKKIQKNRRKKKMDV